MQTTTDLPLIPGHWALDTNHVNVAFAVRHLGVGQREVTIEVDVPQIDARRCSRATSACATPVGAARPGSGARRWLPWPG